MRKLGLLTAAILSASIANTASAALFQVSSNVTDSSSLLGVSDLLAGPNPTAMTITGLLDIDVTGSSYVINSGTITVDGTIGLLAAPTVPVTLYFDNLTSSYSNGVLYDGTGSGSLSYEVNSSGNLLPIDLTTYPLTGVVGAINHLGLPQHGLDLSGGTVNGSGDTISVALCGAYDLVAFAGAGPCTGLIGDNTFFAAVLGNPASIYLEGDITLTAVPVPAAAWLFGSALLSLATVGRRRAQH